MLLPTPSDPALAVADIGTAYAAALAEYSEAMLMVAQTVSSRHVVDAASTGCTPPGAF